MGMEEEEYQIGESCQSYSEEEEEVRFPDFVGVDGRLVFCRSPLAAIVCLPVRRWGRLVRCGHDES